MILLKLPRTGSLAVLSLVLATLVLAACTPAPVRTVRGAGESGQPAREAALSGMPTWGFEGRIAINSGGQAGNARIEWQQDGADFDIRLSAPVTRQSWRLRREGGVASLEGLEGGIRRGADAEALLLEATGWRLPVASLAAWVRGARSDPAAARLTYGPTGLPATLEEQGWTVEYREWEPANPPLPVRVFARRGDASVRLAVEHWSVP